MKKLNLYVPIFNCWLAIHKIYYKYFKSIFFILHVHTPLYSINSRKKDGGRGDLHEGEHNIKWHGIYNSNGRDRDILLDGQMKLEQPFSAHRASIHIEFKLMRLICQIPWKERSGRRRMGKLGKERNANVLLHCFCMCTIYGATWYIADCKWILQQDLLKEFYFEFWLLAKWLEHCISKQTFSLWIGRFSRIVGPSQDKLSRSAGPSQDSPKSCWGHQQCTAPQGGAVGFHSSQWNQPASIMTHVVHPLHGMHSLLWSWNPLNTYTSVNYDIFQPRVYNQPAEWACPKPAGVSSRCLLATALNYISWKSNQESKTPPPSLLHTPGVSFPSGNQEGESFSSQGQG